MCLAAGAAGAGGEKTYVEDVFNITLYDGNSSTQNIVNGVNLGDSVFTSLAGKTITNIGGAITSGNFANINDNVLEVTNGTNYAYTPGIMDIYVDMVTPTIVTGYLISPQGTRNSAVFNTINSFLVKASNDAVNWTVLANLSGYTTGYPAWNPGTFRPFSFSNATPYRYWRLESTDGSNDSISEWALLASVPGSGKGGLIWTKNRTSVNNHNLVDTLRGTSNFLITNGNDPAISSSTVSSFNSNGYNIETAFGVNNLSSSRYVSWTFRRAEKFFDCVSWTGDGAATRTLSHSLKAQPHFIIVKRTDTNSDWLVDSLAWSTDFNGGNPNNGATLNGVGSFNYLGGNYGPYCFASNTTQFIVGTNANVNGGTYIAYLFASDAGGFGDSGAESIIKIGYYSGAFPSSPVITLGWEPQWVLIKKMVGGSNQYTQWAIWDNMRGGSLTANDPMLSANYNQYEDSGSGPAGKYIAFTPTGFIVDPQGNGWSVSNTSSTDKYLYIAIRRGPMKAPTDATTVFSPVLISSPPFPGPFTVTPNFPVDWTLVADRASTNFGGKYGYDRTRGGGLNTTTILDTTSTTAAATAGGGYGMFFDDSKSFKDQVNGGGTSNIYWNFRRAKGFFDIVSWTGTGAVETYNHNLGVVPELMIQKCRSANATPWLIYSAALGNTKRLSFNTAAAVTDTSIWDSTTPTSTTFKTLSGAGNTNISYLFASCPGVSKVGSYTGTGTTQQINCGFANGARFVLIKRTDDVGSWYVWDTARGISSGNDPFILINSSVAETTNTDYIDPYAAGFEISSTAPDPINANGGSFIFLAIA